MFQNSQPKVRQAFNECEATVEEQIRQIQVEAEERVRQAEAEAEERVRRVQVEAEERVRQAQLDLQIEHGRSRQVIDLLKRQNNEYADRNYTLEKAFKALEVMLLEKDQELAAERASHREVLQEEYARSADIENERQELAEQVTVLVRKLEEAEVYRETAKAYVGEHFICKRCGKPYMKWDRGEYCCLDCG